MSKSLTRLLMNQNRLTEPGFESLFELYREELAGLIRELIPKCPPLDLEPYPQLRDCLIDPVVRELGKLKEELSTLETAQSNQWRKRLQQVEESLKPEHQKVFDELFKEAMGCPNAKLYQKKRFAETLARVADVDFLVRIAPGLDSSAYPAVVKHVCEKKVDSDQERLRLLVTYFDQLTRKGFESLREVHCERLGGLIRDLMLT